MSKKILTLVVVGIFVSLTGFAHAQPGSREKELLTAHHTTLLKQYQNEAFSDGQHFFKPLADSLWSIYRLGNRLALYTRLEDRQFYALVAFDKPDEKTVALNWQLKITSGRTVRTLVFQETYRASKSRNYALRLDREASDPQVDWKCLLDCVTACGGNGVDCAECVIKYWDSGQPANCLSVCANAAICIWRNCRKCFAAQEKGWLAGIFSSNNAAYTETRAWGAVQELQPMVNFSGSKYDSMVDQIVTIYISEPNITGAELVRWECPECSDNITYGEVYAVSYNPASVNPAAGMAQFQVRCKVTRNSATPWFAKVKLFYRLYKKDQ